MTRGSTTRETSENSVSALLTTAATTTAITSTSDGGGNMELSLGTDSATLATAPVKMISDDQSNHSKRHHQDREASDVSAGVELRPGLLPGSRRLHLASTGRSVAYR